MSAYIAITLGTVVYFCCLAYLLDKYEDDE